MALDTLVDNAGELARQLAALPPGPLAMDTEFIRERTYYARLCVIQLAAGDQLLLVDALAFDDLETLAAQLGDPAREKLLHAARQDIEVLLPLTGRPPLPVFDTQIAAALLGFPSQVGYGELVRQLLGVDLHKGHARTDWSRRPLTPAQLAYAADDVRYLAPLAGELRARLQAAGRLAWFAEDSQSLADPGLYTVEPAEAWRRFKGLDRLDDAMRSRLRALAAWREEQAMTRDLPRGWVISDAAILEIARANPTAREALASLTSLPPATAARHGRDILAVAQAARISSIDRELPPDAGRPTPEQARQLKRLQQRLTELAGALDLRPEVLATRRDLAALVRGGSDAPVLAGWRRAVVGEPLLAAL